MTARGEIGGVVLTWCAGTDVGRVRRLNEDAFLAQPPVFVVADGMGGHEAGEVASGLTVARLGTLAEAGPPTVDAVAAELQNVNSLLRATRPDGHSGPNMGTTAVGVVLVLNGSVLNWLVFNVGDSRVYRVLGRSMSQITRDHSHVQDLVDLGELEPSLMRTHPHRNVVTRALGADPEVQPDYWVRPLRAGERFLLCSDGLTGEVEDDEIADLVTSDLGPEECVEALVVRALANGGRDNVTVLVIDVESVPTSEDVTTETRPGEDQDAPLYLDLSDGAITGVPLGGVTRPLFPDGEPEDDATGVISVVPPVFPVAVPAPEPRVVSTIDTVPHAPPPPAEPSNGRNGGELIEAMPPRLTASATPDRSRSAPPTGDDDA